MFVLKRNFFILRESFWFVIGLWLEIEYVFDCGILVVLRELGV